MKFEDGNEPGMKYPASSRQLPSGQTGAERHLRFIKGYGYAPSPMGPHFPQDVTQEFTLNSPIGIAVDRQDNVWACDVGNNRIVILNASLDKIVNVITCLVDPPDDKDPDSQLFMSFHVCPHPEKNLMYVSEMGHFRILVFEYPQAETASLANGYAKCLRAFNDTEQVETITAGNLRQLQQNFDASQQSVKGEDYYSKNHFNGLAFLRDPAGELNLFVADEFFHLVKGNAGEVADNEAFYNDDNRGRIIQFTEDGSFIRDFRSLRPRHPSTAKEAAGQAEKEPEQYDLLWPQGVCADSEGHLYIANTGHYHVIKCDPFGTVTDDHVLEYDVRYGPTCYHAFGDKKGSGYGNILRSISVIEDRIFIANQRSSTISVYNLAHTKMALIEGKTATTLREDGFLSTIQDAVYSKLQNSMLFAPYQICKGTGKNKYYLTEPFGARISQVDIDLTEANYAEIEEFVVGEMPEGLASRAAPALLKHAVGARRNQGNDQFNAVSGIISIPQGPREQPVPKPPAEMPNSQLTPFHQQFAAMTQMAMVPYTAWYQAIAGNSLVPGRGEGEAFHCAVDAGNWSIKEFRGDMVRAASHSWTPGIITGTPYYPPTPLLGQICPGTPILLMVNTVVGFVAMYQFDFSGHLIPYGIPFGVDFKQEDQDGLGIAFPDLTALMGLASLGTGEEPPGMVTLKGPQGITVSDQGEIYVTEPTANRISKWHLPASGVARFVCHLEGQDGFADEAGQVKLAPMVPTDVALDEQGRLFVCDQYNSIIRIFAPDGTELRRFGRKGYWEGAAEDACNMLLPTSIAIENGMLIVNDLVNRALKIFEITEENGRMEFSFLTGEHFFEEFPQNGGLWMPFNISVDGNRIYVPDSTYNIVNIYEY